MCLPCTWVLYILYSAWLRVCECVWVCLLATSLRSDDAATRRMHNAQKNQTIRRPIDTQTQIQMQLRQQIQLRLQIRNTATDAQICHAASDNVQIFRKNPKTKRLLLPSILLCSLFDVFALTREGGGGGVGRGRCLCGRALAYSKQIIYRYVCIRDVCKLCVENRKVLPSHTRIVSTHMRLFRNHHHCCSCCSYSLVWKCSIFEIAYSIASIGIIWEKQEKQKSLGCFFFLLFFFIFSFIIISMSFGKFMFAEVISILFSSYLLFIQHMRPHLMLVS